MKTKNEQQKEHWIMGFFLTALLIVLLIPPIIIGVIQKHHYDENAKKQGTVTYFSYSLPQKYEIVEESHVIYPPEVNYLPLKTMLQTFTDDVFKVMVYHSDYRVSVSYYVEHNGQRFLDYSSNPESFDTGANIIGNGLIFSKVDTGVPGQIALTYGFVKPAGIFFAVLITIGESIVADCLLLALLAIIIVILAERDDEGNAVPNSPVTTGSC